MRKLEKEFILAGLRAESYNQSTASERLGVTEANLRYVIKNHKIVPARELKAKGKKAETKDICNNDHYTFELLQPEEDRTWNLFVFSQATSCGE